jgi:hypothetical protein
VLDRPRAPRRDGTGGTGQVEEVGALGLVELERASECVQDELGDAGDVAALQPPVVLDAHPGQRGDLLAAQPGHAALAIARQAGLVGRDPGPARGQELGDVVGGVHGLGLPFRPRR